ACSRECAKTAGATAPAVIRSPTPPYRRPYSDVDLLPFNLPPFKSSIRRHRRVDFLCPALDPALQVVQSVIALRTQLADGARAARAATAVDDDVDLHRDL